jgi:outer membrane protein OmpA-like peptidoglycan-associated protein/Tol biopolymer transport system component
MKRFLTTVFLVAACCTVFAQNKQHEEYLRHEGDNFYYDEQYSLAIEYYRELVTLSDQQSDILYRLADSYHKNFNYKEAEAYYLKAYYQSPEKFPFALYYYALMLKLNGAFDESILFFSKFITASENNTALKDYVEQAAIDRAGSEMAKSQLANSRYRINTENLNSAFNDYAPALRDSTTLVITSGRVESNRQAIDDRYGEGFTDNIYFVKAGNTWQDKTRQLFSVTNTKYNEGSGCFNFKGDKYYFTYCGKSNTNCGIYVSTFANTKWSEPVALTANVNAANAETKHPVISKGGDTIMFASNRSGGLGNYDIWMSVNSGNENWGPAMNLGPGINTKLNELSPAFTIFPHIFFLSSDGHQNYGGLDLYMAKRLSNGTMNLYNLDYPFNSNRDDCFISMRGTKAYFSSNRESGKGGFDIYSVSISNIVSFTSRISLKSKGARSDVQLDGRTETISNLNLLAMRNEDRFEYQNLTYEKKKVVDKMVSSRNNQHMLNREDFPNLSDEEFNELERIADMQYKVLLLERQFAGKLLSKINTSGNTGNVTLTGVVKDSVSGKALGNQKIILMDHSGEVLKITHTNEAGQFRFTSIDANLTLYIRLENVTDIARHATVTDLRLSNSGSEQAFENIYFDFDHYTLRPEAIKVLTDLAVLLKKNPGAQVELYAYADDRGGEEYNLRLTQKRGQAVLTYLISQGLDQTALAVIAKGKQSGTATPSEIQRQVNRRVEFYLNGAAIRTSTVKTYILKEKRLWNELAVQTGVPINELKALNGPTVEQALIFQPIRLPEAAKISPYLFYSIN